MSSVLSFILLALAVSLDSFSAGLTYGLKKVKIPIQSIFIISICSAMSLLVASVFGQFFEWVLSPKLTETIGGIILVCLGGWALFQVLRPHPKAKEPIQIQEKTIILWEIKSLGLVIQILRRPMKADMDLSGSITGIEAILLGFALSLDAFGAGVGAAMLNFPPLIVSCLVVFMSSFFLFAGMSIGKRASQFSWVQPLSFIPGIVLILLGVWKL
ncbi:putative sporulation protein YtaF [Bacillus oleivorans]|uniref:Putative sporulation protein YtaF n=1 Tax=Bacillus oleivorans TaxID=1448271 RepID=A0A285CV88_9BACI|nr:sporulation membrane protein YtaF [Bacillus oleivorans]SNX71444.1 putative sporulation protein YtaF [Bacillus oleivorans]